MPRKLTTEEFVKKAQAIHGDKYDYSKVNYIDAKTKVEIICPEHGSFWQSPSSHLKGHGCHRCTDTFKLTTEEFIQRAREIHGDKYDYSKTEYSDSNTKIEIICPEHGSFWQKPYAHLQGHGCPKCANILAANKRALDEIDFIKKAKEVHNSKYDYSNLKYTNNHTKVEIICPEHGSFWQIPSSHLRGHGCPKCEGKHKPTTEEFIQMAREVHGDKYDYSKVEYSNSHTKIEIICPEHGSFWQAPTAHLGQKQGCPICAGHFQYTTEVFIKLAREIHGDKYDYSKVEYVDSKTKVEIICPTHGSFFQRPAMHLSGQGCPTCAREKSYESLFSNTQEFIKKAKSVHGDKYDYSKVNYIDAKTKVEIICPEHGSFWQAPSHHLQTQGCPLCSKINRAKSQALDNKTFVQRSQKIHNAKYSYKKIDYKNNSTPVEIICPKHGSFFQRPDNHLSGSGCPLCAKERSISVTGISKEENIFAELLEKHLSRFTIKRNHIDKNRYPYHCDFYISERDLFIEYNGWWMHGREWCDKTSTISKTRIEKWSKKDSVQYKSAIETYTKRDVLKRQTACKNKLNYVVLWDKKDIDKWFELGCPGGHDYDFEYSWIKDDKERSEWLKNKVKR